MISALTEFADRYDRLTRERDLSRLELRGQGAERTGKAQRRGLARTQRKRRSR